MPANEDEYMNVAYVDASDNGDATCIATVTRNTGDVRPQYITTYLSDTQITRGYGETITITPDYLNFGWVERSSEPIITWDITNATTATTNWGIYTLRDDIVRPVAQNQLSVNEEPDAKDEDAENDWDIKISKNDLDDFIEGDNT